MRVERIYIIAGEASGDLHGAALVRALKMKDPNLHIRGWGGDQMAAAGCEIVKHFRDLAFMGFVEVIMNIRTIRRNFQFAKSDIIAFQADTIVFLDYPGFNIRMLEWAKQKGYRTVWYIAPQLWAWHESRVKKLKAYVDALVVILPFEKPYFEKHGLHPHLVSHPLVARFRDFPFDKKLLFDQGVDNHQPYIALLPGSRKQEIRNMLPAMRRLPDSFPGYQWVIPMAPAIPETFYRKILGTDTSIKLISGLTYHILYYASAAVVTSGTATLETALAGVPQVVVYKGNPISYAIARRIIKVKYISLVNLLLDKPLLKELIQHEMTTENISNELAALISPSRRTDVLAGYSELKSLLGNGDASIQTAEIILNEK